MLYPLSYEGGGWCEMWCEIRRHTLRHLCRGYWRVLKLIELRQSSGEHQGWTRPETLDLRRFNYHSTSRQVSS